MRKTLDCENCAQEIGVCSSSSSVCVGATRLVCFAEERFDCLFSSFVETNLSTCVFICRSARPPHNAQHTCTHSSRQTHTSHMCDTQSNNTESTCHASKRWQTTAWWMQTHRRRNTFSLSFCNLRWISRKNGETWAGQRRTNSNRVLDGWKTKFKMALTMLPCPYQRRLFMSLNSQCQHLRRNCRDNRYGCVLRALNVHRHSTDARLPRNWFRFGKIKFKCLCVAQHTRTKLRHK